MPTNPHSITHRPAGSTRDLGYRSLESYTGPVPSHVLRPPQPTSQAGSFVQGVVDASAGQQHHELRAALVGFVVGAVVGHEIARMRARQR